jgi:hypothetical protein
MRVLAERALIYECACQEESACAMPGVRAGARRRLEEDARKAA